MLGTERSLYGQAQGGTTLHDHLHAGGCQASRIARQTGAVDAIHEAHAATAGAWLCLAWFQLRDLCAVGVGEGHVISGSPYVLHDVCRLFA